MAVMASFSNLINFVEFFQMLKGCFYSRLERRLIVVWQGGSLLLNCSIIFTLDSAINNSHIYKQLRPQDKQRRRGSMRAEVLCMNLCYNVNLLLNHSYNNNCPQHGETFIFSRKMRKSLSSQPFTLNLPSAAGENSAAEGIYIPRSSLEKDTNAHHG